MNIPKRMSNEESQLVAGVIVAERRAAIASFDLMAAKNKLAKYYNGA